MQDSNGSNLKSNMESLQLQIPWNTVADLSPVHFRKQAATDGTYGSNIGEFPGFGGLIQGQIYIPVESKIPSFWKPMIFWGIPCFCLLRGEHWVIELLILPKIGAPVVFHPKREHMKSQKTSGSLRSARGPKKPNFKSSLLNCK